MRLPCRPPQAGHSKPFGQREAITTARHLSSVPYSSSNAASLSPFWNCTRLRAIAVPSPSSISTEAAMIKRLRKEGKQEELTAKQRKPPMPTQCNPELFEFARAEGRAVVASFDGGAITSDAGALLLGATDRVLGLTRRLAACFQDRRDPVYTEHAVETLVMQRVVGIALGYEDLNDHDQLRHDPVLAALANKLT